MGLGIDVIEFRIVHTPTRKCPVTQELDNWRIILRESQNPERMDALKL